MKGTVSVVKYENPESIDDVIKLSGVFDKFKKGDRVFIKPNIVSWIIGASMPPWGVITTSLLVEKVVRYMKDLGAGQIVIGEGTLTGPNDTETAADAYETLGYNEMSKRYGVKVINCMEESFSKVDLGEGIELDFCSEFVNSDYVINLPVLKTHAQAMVSLSYKNIKGCLDMNSRKLCHSDNMETDLDSHIARLVNSLPKSCAILDGIYTLERGPAPSGRARRSDILIASEDMLLADMVGAAALGFDPAEVPHIMKACGMKGISPTLDEIEITGVPVKEVASPHTWDFMYNKENTLPIGLENAGVKGVSYPKYDHSLCSYCSGITGFVQVAIADAWKGVPFDDVEILTGKMESPTPGMKHTLLLGKCQVKLNKDNPDIENKILVPGCPPDIDKMADALRKAGIDANQAIFDNYQTSGSIFMARYEGRTEFAHDFYRINK